MVIAVGSYDFIGVDIEIWDNIDHLAIAEQCFAKTEKTVRLGLPENKKQKMFYQYWTRKESFAKATSAGITMDVSKVITATENGIPRFASKPSPFGNVLKWKLVDLEFETGVSCALTLKTNVFSNKLPELIYLSLSNTYACLYTFQLSPINNNPQPVME